MSDFVKFKDAVTRQFATMRGKRLFCTEVGKDEMWDAYLAAFPDGSNPIYRERTEHDCSCCKQFIRTAGNVVAINDDGTLTTIWDGITGDFAYDSVSTRMAELVRSRAIRDAFLHYERGVGTDKNYEQTEDEHGGVVTWHHFRLDLTRSNSGVDCYAPKASIPTLLGEMRSTHDVLLRSLREITMDAVDTTLELIAQGSLYRGNEHVFAVQGFHALKVEFDKLAPEQHDTFVWSRCNVVAAPIARIRNTAIGTLLQDLSEGLSLEESVRKFEVVMAPANYKRPTALVTQKMIDAARNEIEQLGLSTALERRYARLTDISAADVIWTDRNARKTMLNGDAFDGLATKSKSAQDFSKLETIGIDAFIESVLPRAESVEVLLENRHAGNMVSLITPVHGDAKPLFKWDNGFSWSYAGDVADSVRERVKRAGGNVTGDLCCRLAWHNYDDLDLHMVESRQGAGGSYEIYFGKRGRPSPSGGNLDVDMNAGGGQTREPVENIFYGSRDKMRTGTYVLAVHQFAKRESVDVGFEVEIDWLGTLHRYVYEKPVRQGERIDVATLHYDRNLNDMKIASTLPSVSASREMWGLKTQDFVRASAIMYSPNHWEDNQAKIGNKHYLFMLEGCKNGEAQGARGFFNEFLRSDLDKHRKVIELVGGKMRLAADDNQLSGLGFSDTRRAEIVVRVRGSFTRMLKVVV